MSIIEKAVDKLTSDQQHSVAQQSEHDPAVPTPSILEPADAGLSNAEVIGSPPETAIDGVGEGQVPGGTAEPADAVDAESVDISLRVLAIEGMLSPDGDRSRMAEEYRMIKRPLLVKAFSDEGSLYNHPNLIMVTSSLSGEGKTFTTLNLAISIAMEMDRTVLLVDSDLAKPRMSRMLQVSERPGFTECLRDPKVDLGQFILSTDVPKLKILPAGTRHQRSTELLASNTMRARLNELALRYSDRIVLFDSPPLLVTSEASVLARNMGQVSLVVEYGSTPQYLVKEALGMLETKDAVSLILNKTRDDFLGLGGGSYGYGYKYGYGYSYGYGAGGDQ